ncbi:hypothetical protein [Neptunitalea lumnitzerae]|nr:hypothetical protein [Neptunitalea sp. Y10]
MSLYQEVYHGESFSEEDFYAAAEYVFQPEIGGASQEEIESFLIERVSTMTPEEAESFWSNLGNVAKKVGSGALKMVSKAAPMVGTAVGAMYGVPQLGGMVGGLAGNLAGAGSRALDRMPNFKSTPKRRVRRKRYVDPALRRAWNQTKTTAKNVGRHMIVAGNEYAAKHPVQPMKYGKSNESVLTEFFNDPVFEAALIRNAYADNFPESLSESDFDYINKVEAINYLTEGILSEYYGNNIITDGEYSVDQYGELIANYPEDRVERIESYIESF